jgi:aspartyl-tRNA(Asn)/glutamyl-tRNA(Gln) amidotransferase subunit C
MAVYWKIDKQTVKHVAKLARLNLSDEELEKFTKQLEDVLVAFKKIDSVDTKNVEPSFQPTELKNIWRDDVVEPWEWDPLANTKHKEKRFFKGPRIV